MIKGYNITHKEPELAEFMLNYSLADRDFGEVHKIQRRMNEVKRHLAIPEAV